MHFYLTNHSFYSSFTVFTVHSALRPCIPILPIIPILACLGFVWFNQPDQPKGAADVGEEWRHAACAWLQVARPCASDAAT